MNFDSYYNKLAKEYCQKRKIYYWKQRYFIVEDGYYHYIRKNDLFKFVANDKLLIDCSHLLFIHLKYYIRENSKDYPESLKIKLDKLVKLVKTNKKHNCNIKIYKNEI